MKLLECQVNSISDIFRDIGQVCFATMFVGPLVGGSISWITVISGLVFVAIAWLFSVLLTKKI